MKKFDDIDIKIPLIQEDFFTIFNSQLPLNEEEKERIKTNYFDMYNLFLKEGANPEESFAAIRILFLSQEQQIKYRIHDDNRNI
ncbi:MAG: hypothetical protein PHF86_01360 [Candidatus Nanoarchaeia archaeon]|nr:hypothetical protein [Candidatus Nanoarchaeia archaeon]